MAQDDRLPGFPHGGPQDRPAERHLTITIFARNLQSFIALAIISFLAIAITILYSFSLSESSSLIITFIAIAIALAIFIANVNPPSLGSAAA